MPQDMRVQVRAVDQRAKMPYRPGIVNFSRYKAGDSGFTKTISQPPALPEAEETVIQSQKILQCKLGRRLRRLQLK